MQVHSAPTREAARPPIDASTHSSTKVESEKRPRLWRRAFSLVKDAALEWNADKAPRLGAALSYYTVFALAPVLLVAISVAGLVFGEDAARGRILHELQGLLGFDTARLVEQMLAKSAARGAGVVGTVIGLGTLLIGATAVMIELEAALDTIWKVRPPKNTGLRGEVRDRVLSLGLVLSLGFLLLVSLVTSALLSALGGMLDRFSFPGVALLGQLINNLFTLFFIGGFFALVYRYLAHARIGWKDACVGGLFTSLLFHLGKVALGIYLGRASVGSTFGAASSLALLLVWVYYTAQIVLYGAELTRLYATRFGQGVTPKPGSDFVDPKCTDALPS